MAEILTILCPLLLGIAIALAIRVAQYRRALARAFIPPPPLIGAMSDAHRRHLDEHAKRLEGSAVLTAPATRAPDQR